MIKLTKYIIILTTYCCNVKIVLHYEQLTDTLKYVTTCLRKIKFGKK